jgi:hypothetical protein
LQEWKRRQIAALKGIPGSIGLALVLGIVCAIGGCAVASAIAHQHGNVGNQGGDGGKFGFLLGIIVGVILGVTKFATKLEGKE